MVMTLLKYVKSLLAGLHITNALLYYRFVIPKRYIHHCYRGKANYTIYINQLHLKSIEGIKGLNQ